MGRGIVASTSAPQANYEFTKAPAGLIWAAVALLIASIALLAPRAMPTSIAGYLLAPLGVTVLVSLFRYKDVLASRSNTYAGNGNLQKIATITVVVAFLVGIGHAWIIATDIAKALGS